MNKLEELSSWYDCIEFEIDKRNEKNNVRNDKFFKKSFDFKSLGYKLCQIHFIIIKINKELLHTNDDIYIQESILGNDVRDRCNYLQMNKIFPKIVYDNLINYGSPNPILRDFLHEMIHTDKYSEYLYLPYKMYDNDIGIKFSSDNVYEIKSTLPIEKIYFFNKNVLSDKCSICNEQVGSFIRNKENVWLDCNCVFHRKCLDGKKTNFCPNCNSVLHATLYSNRLGF
jgi:hypothetical protein